MVASAAVWQVVESDWDREALPLGWVSFSAAEAHTLIPAGGISHLLVEARGDLLHQPLVEAADSEGIALVALITGPASEDVARALGIALRVRGPDDLRHILAPRVTSATANDATVASGLTVAVWGPTGAPGRTTVATSVASLMAGRGLRVLLVDADSRSGAIAPALGLLDEVPGFIAGCRLADRDQLTADDLRRLSHRYECAGSTFDVLTGVTSGRLYPEVTPDTITQLVEMAQGVWEVIVLDTGSDIIRSDSDPSATTAAATTCLRISDEAVALCQATPVGVARFARVFADAVSLRGGKPFPVVLNGVDQSRRSLSDEATIREALRRFAGVGSVQIVARDSGACRQAEMLGVSVADCVPGSSFVSGLKTLAGVWVEDALARRRRQGAVTEELPETGRSQRRKKRPRSPGKWQIISQRGFALR